MFTIIIKIKNLSHVILKFLPIKFDVSLFCINKIKETSTEVNPNK